MTHVIQASLRFVGTIAALLAPLSADALTVTIDGASVQISTTSAACTSGYNLCAFITPGTYGGWTVRDVSSTNRARIMIGDNSTAGSLDLLKLTGITFTPTVVTGTKTAKVVITHTYNAGGGNPTGDYSWGYGMAGYFDPLATENVVGNQLQQTGQGNFAGKIAALGSGLNTGVIATPSTNNLNGSVTSSKAATVVMPACNTGSARCAPAITQTFTITVAGADTLVLSDSVIAGGGTCHPVTQVIPIPNTLYQLMLKLDPTAPNDINQLSAWLTKMGEKYLKNPQQKALLAFLIKELEKWLAQTVPGSCPEIDIQIDQVIAADLAAELVVAQAAGAVPVTSTATFTPLGDIPGGGFESVAEGISADGSVVVGAGQGVTGQEVSRWTAGTGMVSLGPTVSGGSGDSASATSGDGSVVVGSMSTTTSFHAFRWAAGTGMVDLGTLPSTPGSNPTSIAWAVSEDGTVVVGYSRHTPAVGPAGIEAFRWTQAGGMVGLGTLPGASILDSRAHSISADGSMIFGLAFRDGGVWEAFRWMASTGMQGLGFPGLPWGVSRDGSILVGEYHAPPSSTSNAQTFRWSQATGLELLPTLSNYQSLASDVSDDGLTIVGVVLPPLGEIEAVIWRKGSGGWTVKTLKDVLVTEFGITAATNWALQQASAMTPDGRTIVGIGRNPSGQEEAWMIQLP